MDEIMVGMVRSELSITLYCWLHTTYLTRKNPFNPLDKLGTRVYHSSPTNCKQLCHFDRPDELLITILIAQSIQVPTKLVGNDLIY